MATPNWRFNTHSDTIALTHGSLHAHWLVYLQHIRSQNPPNMNQARVDRCCELLLLGMRLCNLGMGTAAEINELVDMRLEEIDQEIQPFLPNPLEKAPLERAFPTASGPTDRYIEDTQSDNDIRSEELSLPRPHGPDSLLGNSDDEEWEDSFSPSDEEDEPSPLRGLPIRARAPSESSDSTESRDPWSETQSKLVQTRKQFDEFYAEGGVEKGVVYEKTFGMLQRAIQRAYQRLPWVDPTKLWLDTERAYKTLTELPEDTTEERMEEMLAALRTESHEEGEVPVLETLPRVAEPSPRRTGMFAPYTPQLPAVLNDIMIATALMNQRNESHPAATSAPASEPRASPAASSSSSNSHPHQPSSPVHPQNPPAESSNPYSFPSILHGPTPMHLMPPLIQRAYRNNVQDILSDLWHATDVLDFRRVLDAYAEHVEREVPRLEE
jgi:hypothetical protein